MKSHNTLNLSSANTKFGFLVAFTRMRNQITGVVGRVGPNKRRNLYQS